jgi:PadR family transcriptional regulator, regulatory protein AphA
MKHLPFTVEHALLGFLAQQPMHGYEIHQRLAKAADLGRVWHVKQSQLYALLIRLEQAGYIVARLEPQETRPTRKVFELTPSGQKAFTAWLETPVRHARQFRLEFLAKLYFAHQAGPAKLEKLLVQQENICQQWLMSYQEHAEQLHADQPYAQLVHQFRMGQVQAMFNWLNACRATLLPSPGGLSGPV